MKKSLPHILLAALLLTLVACTEKESDLGISLVDPATLWHGTADTLYASAAYTEVDDSLTTAALSTCILGRYTDATFGSVNAELYSQIALPTTANAISLDQVEIDSVTLNLVIDHLFPDSFATNTFHLQVHHLSEALSSDSTYYSFSVVPVDETATLLDTTISCSATDTTISLRLAPAIHTIISQYGTAAQFAENVKGLRLRIMPGSDNAMLAINLAASATNLAMHYRYGTDTSVYRFNIGTGAVHFVHIEHDYTGTPFADGGHIDGSQTLYLEPLAGHNVRLNFDSAVAAFHATHPRAIIHYAELLLPVDATADALHPAQLLAIASRRGSTEYYIPDITDPVTYRIYDGTSTDNTYRLRVTQHLQSVAAVGSAPLIQLVINARRSTAPRTILHGIRHAEPPRIAFIYSE